jgi:prepilin-type N-terminal cleavage/methylation domain-containing protein
MQQRTQNAFTLIELLVVIAIIALLASIVLIALGSARSKARDSTRIADLNQIATALQLYYADNGLYPVAAGGAGSVCNSGQNTMNDPWCRDSSDNAGTTPIANWIPNLDSTYIAALPHNPKPYGPNQSWPFHYESDGTHYYLMVGLENATSAACPTNATQWPFARQLRRNSPRHECLQPVGQ